jgi:hypothetical protein
MLDYFIIQYCNCSLSLPRLRDYPLFQLRTALSMDDSLWYRLP